MTALWQPPSGVRVEPGAWHGHRRAVCDRCGWWGTSTASRLAAQQEAETHECDPADVERVRLRDETRREPVVAVPTEG